MKLFLALFLICSVRLVVAQDITNNLSRHKTDSLLKELTRNISEPDRMRSLLQLAQFYILKPGEVGADLDSATRFIARAEQLDKTVSSPECLGYLKFTQALLYREKGERNKGRLSAEEAIRLLRPIDAKRDLGLAYYELAQYFDYSNPAQLPEKIRLTELATSSFEDSGDVELQAFSNKMLADLYDNAGQNMKALEKIELSFRLYKSIHHRELQSVFSIFASIYYSRADFIQALKYELAALETSKSLKDTTMQVCEINNGVGAIYIKLSDYQKAIEYFKNALDIAEEYKDKNNVILLTYNIVNSMVHLGRPNEALHFLKNIPGDLLMSDEPSVSYCIPISHLIILTSLHKYNDAKVYGEKLEIQLVNAKLSIRDQSIIHVAMIRYLTDARKYRQALVHLRMNDSIQQLQKDPATMSRNLELWFTLDTSRGNYKSAIRHLLANNKLNDSVLKDNKTRALSKITSFYKNEEKEAAIKLLEAKSRLQQVGLQHAVNTRNWIIGLVIMLVILLIVSFDRYRVKQRINQMLEVKQARISTVNKLLIEQRKDLQAEKDGLLSENEWLLNEIHHRVKNNLHTVVSLLESQAFFLKNDALKAIEKSQHRIYAMSLVHQQLYDPRNLKTVDFIAFVPEFVRYMTDSFNISNKIRFQLNIQQVALSIAQAIPLALIINEAVSNAIQYAFPDNRPGVIKISIKRSDRQITLTVSDNGVGFDTSGTDNPTDSLGLTLMNGLCSDIEGKIDVVKNHGTQISVVFAASPEANTLLNLDEL